MRTLPLKPWVGAAALLCAALQAVAQGPAADAPAGPRVPSGLGFHFGFNLYPQFQLPGDSCMHHRKEPVNSRAVFALKHPEGIKDGAGRATGETSLQGIPARCFHGETSRTCVPKPSRSTPSPSQTVYLTGWLMSVPGPEVQPCPEELWGTATSVPATTFTHGGPGTRGGPNELRYARRRI